GPAAHRPTGVCAARDPWPGARPRAVVRLPAQPYSDLRHHLHPADRIRDAVHAVRHAVRGHLDAPDLLRTGGVGAGQWRELVADLPPGAAAVAHARPVGRLDLDRKSVG